MKILVTGAGGFLGGHLVKRLSVEYPTADITATDIKPLAHWYQVDKRCTLKPEVDLRKFNQCATLFDTPYDQTWMLACDHGGIGYLKTREYECGLDININTNTIQCHMNSSSDLLFFASSACVYNDDLQKDTANVVYLKESDAHPASPDSVYGWVKLLTEKIILAAVEDKKLNARIARIHGCYGPYNSFADIKEKAPNALLRKALVSTIELEVWNSLDSVRSFMYVDDCIEGFMRLLKTDYKQPINVGSDMTVTIGEVATIAAQVAEKELTIVTVAGEQGVAARSCDCTLMEKVLGWKPTIDVRQGLTLTRKWMDKLV
jgi:nucleoside-diphosphate-sugar epimerase